jgi:hypothetical protein
MAELSRLLLPMLLQEKFRRREREERLKEGKEEKDLRLKILDLQQKRLKADFDADELDVALGVAKAKREQQEATLEYTRAHTEALKGKDPTDTADRRKVARTTKAMDQLLVNQGMPEEDLAVIGSQDPASVDAERIPEIRQRLMDTVNKAIGRPEIDPKTGRPVAGGVGLSSEERDALLNYQHDANSALDALEAPNKKALVQAEATRGALKVSDRGTDKLSADLRADNLPKDSMMLAEGRNYLSQVFGKVKEGKESELQQEPLRKPGLLEGTIPSEELARAHAPATPGISNPDRSMSDPSYLYQRRFAQQVSGGQDPTGLVLNPSLKPLKAIAQTPGDLRQLAQAWDKLNEVDRNAVSMHLLFGQYLPAEKRAANLEQLRQALGLVKPMQDRMQPQGQQGAPQALPGNAGGASPWQGWQGPQMGR